MPKANAKFQDQVRRCAAEIRVWLPDLADRHSPLIVLAALTEHVGGALFLCQEAGACSPARVRAIIKRVEDLAFTEAGPPQAA